MRGSTHPRRQRDTEVGTRTTPRLEASSDGVLTIDWVPVDGASHLFWRQLIAADGRTVVTGSWSRGIRTNSAVAYSGPAAVTRALSTRTHTRRPRVFPSTQSDRKERSTTRNSGNSCSGTRLSVTLTTLKVVRAFLHTTYEAAAELGNWDRDALDTDPGRWADRQA